MRSVAGVSATVRGPRGGARRLRGLLLALLAAGACGGPDAVDLDAPRAPIAVRASVDRSTVTIRDRVRLTLEVEYDETLTIAPMGLGDELGGLEVLESGRTPLRTVRGRAALVDWWLLTPPTVGSYVIPPIEVVGRTDDGREERTSSDEVFVEVLSVLPEDGSAEDIRGLKPLVAEPALWPWLAVPAGVAALVGLWWWWRRRLRGIADPGLSPHERAFLELERLRQTDFSDLDQLRLYYFSLSSILRGYFEERFGLNTTDLTTVEIEARITEVETLDQELEDRFLRILRSTDEVKYAAVVPGQAEIEEVYESALSFVEATVPADGEEGREEEGGGSSQASKEGPEEPEPGRSVGSTGTQPPAPASAAEPEDDARFRP